MLNVVIEDGDVFIVNDSSIDLLVFGDTPIKNLPTPEEIQYAVNEAVKALFRRNQRRKPIYLKG